MDGNYFILHVAKIPIMLADTTTTDDTHNTTNTKMRSVLTGLLKEQYESLQKREHFALRGEEKRGEDEHNHHLMYQNQPPQSDESSSKALSIEAAPITKAEHDNNNNNTTAASPPSLLPSAHSSSSSSTSSTLPTATLSHLLQAVTELEEVLSLMPGVVDREEEEDGRRDNNTNTNTNQREPMQTETVITTTKQQQQQHVVEGGVDVDLAAWVAGDGTLIGIGSLETCGNGRHGYHPPTSNNQT